MPPAPAISFSHPEQSFNIPLLQMIITFSKSKVMQALEGAGVDPHRLPVADCVALRPRQPKRLYASNQERVSATIQESYNERHWTARRADLSTVCRACRENTALLQLSCMKASTMVSAHS